MRRRIRARKVGYEILGTGTGTGTGAVAGAMYGGEER